MDKLDLIVYSLMGSAAAAIRSIIKKKGFWQSIGSSVVGYLMAISLTPSLEQEFHFMNEDGIAFLVGLLSTEIADFVTDLMKGYIKQKNGNQS